MPPRIKTNLAQRFGCIPIFIFRLSEIMDITGSQLVQSSQLQCDPNTSCKGVYQGRERVITYICLVQKEEELEGLETLRSIAELPSPTETSISIITPPKVNSASMMKTCSIQYLIRTTWLGHTQNSRTSEGAIYPISLASTRS